jgi:phospholipase/carboxylesterase
MAGDAGDDGGDRDDDGSAPGADAEALRQARRGRLRARPAAHAAPSAAVPPPGTRPLGLGGHRDGLLMVPPRAGGAGSLPLLVMLHGAGGGAGHALRLLEAQAREAGIALLAPESRGATWDLILGGLGPDVAFLDAALRHAFAALPVDPGRLAIGGFSDGASYALSLGLANGDLFRRVLAFSPGFAAPPATMGRPALYVSHGTADEVLPIDRCSRRLVPRLQRAGYAVRYEEFEGGHVVPAGAVADALALLRAG